MATLIVAVIGSFIVALIVGVALGGYLKKKAVEANLDAAHASAGSITEAAKKEAENIKKEAALAAQDSLYKSKQELEEDARQSRKEFQSIEKRLLGREENLDKKYDVVERKESELIKEERTLSQKERGLEDKERSIEASIEEQGRKLQEIAGMSSEEAKKQLLDAVEEEARLEAAKTLKRLEEETRLEAEKKSKDILAQAIQRYAGEYVCEKTVSVVNLPSDEMKGRIIGREGRNIRAIEAITGIDIIIDDTPEAVILSGHNPVRRHVAKLALEQLVSDGRIHPARVEEVVAKVGREVEKGIIEAGERAVFDTGLHGVHPEIQKLIGRLQYRTSYAQNVYAHSLEVAFICGIMASELRLPVKLAKRAGLLHDIGKAMDHEVEGPHALIGADFARKHGEKPKIVGAIGQHHNDKPESIFGVLVQAADTLSAARPGARREMFESYIKRLEDLETIAKGFDGVDKTYALQAGREIRVMVESASVDDNMATVLSRDIAKKIEKELSYPGQIRVTVIRETRSVGYAR